VPLDRPIEQYESVGVWAQALRDQWGGDPLGEEPEKLESLAAFCDFVGRDPDELLDFCFLRRKASGERFGSVKRRDEVARQLGEFRDGSGLDAPAARKLVNDVLSFLIHGGVLIHPGMV
jgi:hypothetical protein